MEHFSQSECLIIKLELCAKLFKSRLAPAHRVKFLIHDLFSSPTEADVVCKLGINKVFRRITGTLFYKNRNLFLLEASSVVIFA